jgi:phosphatidylglycerol:prolipoprotein diacylglycerol transferase
MQSAFYIGVNPVIFYIGPIAIGWYLLFVTLAFLTLIGWIVRENRLRRLLTSGSLVTAALIVIISGIVFAKLAHIIDLFSYFRQNPGQIFSGLFSGEGFAIWGAVLGAVISLWVYSRISHKFRFGLMVDMLAPGLILAQAIGRVGCTLNGCCYGIDSNSPLAFIYTNPNTYAPVGIPVLPTQLFELLFDLAVFGLLLRLRSKIKPEGMLFLVYLALYASWRFGSDFIRAGTPFLLGLHEAQVISLAVLLVTIPLMIFRGRMQGTEAIAGV